MRQLEILLSFFLLLHTFVKQTFKLPLLNQSVLGIQMEKRRDILKIHSTLLELLSSHFSQFSYSLPLCTNVFCIRGVTKDFSRFSDSTLNNTRSLRKQAKSRKGIIRNSIQIFFCACILRSTINMRTRSIEKVCKKRHDF